MLMMRKIVLSLIAVLVCGMLSAFAQNKQVTGTVVNEQGDPMIGVTVQVKGTQYGTSSGVGGKFTVNAGSDDVLIFSYIGYLTVEKPVGAQTVIDVTLQEDARTLEDVTVVAYGTKRKEDLVGSVSKIASDKLTTTSSASVSRALEGAVAGVTVVSTSGQPGKDASIIVRGVGSLSGSNAALIVVDGVPFNGSLSDINAEDIDNISVSKDAVSNSLYGSRAANGVVMVTTKSGKADRTRISLKGTWGVISRGVPDYDMATDPAEFYELTWYGMRNTQMANGSDLAAASKYASQNLLSELGNYNAFIIPAGEYLVGTNGKLNSRAVERYNDTFEDAMFGSSLRQEYVASANGGTEKTDYYMSIGYLDEDSYITGSSYNRITSRLNVNTQLRKWLKVGSNMSYARTDSRGVQEGSGLASNPFDVARSWAPIFPVHAYDAEGNMKFNEDGTPVYDSGQGETDGTTNRPTAQDQNVIVNLKEDIRRNKITNLYTRSYVEVTFLKNFKFSANYAYDYRHNQATEFYTPILGDGEAFGGRGTKSSITSSTTNFNQLLSYSTVFCQDHSIEALVGHEFYKYYYTYLAGQKTNFFDESNPELDNGGEMQALSSYTSSHNIEGYFAKADYNYAHKYYLSGAVRRDGTSRFLNRWGTFWSVGGAWRISSEAFMADAKWINDLKLRASYGTQGNENVLNYTPYVDQYTVTWDGSQLGTAYHFYGNPDLTWEKQKTFDVGLDFRLFDRVYGSIDYFRRRTDDMLFRRNLPISAGRPYNWENLGAMRNTGIEVDLSVDIIKKKNVTWTVQVVGSHYENTILTLPEEYKETGMANGMQRMREGHDRFQFYMQKYAGISETGAPMWYKDITDDAGNVTGQETTSVYSEATRYYLDKSGLPDFTGGVNTSLRLYGFDLSIQTSFGLGGWVYDYGFVSTMSSSYYIGHNRELWKTWDPTTGEGKYPIWNRDDNSNSMTQSSDLWLTSASYFNIRNITLGYTFPSSWMKKLGIESVRVFVSADNVALFSKRKGLDPRVSLGGNDLDDYGGFSLYRTISGGISFNF